MPSQTEFKQPGCAKYKGNYLVQLIEDMPVMGPTTLGVYLRVEAVSYSKDDDITTAWFVNHVDGSYGKD